MAISQTFLEHINRCPPSIKCQMSPVRIRKGQFLMRAGEMNDFVYLITSGTVRVYHYTDSGELFVSYINSINRHIFGDVEAIRDTYAPILRNVVATEDATFLKVPRKAFLDWLHLDSDFCIYLLRGLCDNIIHSTEYAITNARLSLKKRCAMFILDNSDKEGLVSFGKETLSGILATSLRSTNRVLKEFRDNEMIDTTGKSIQILDREALKKLTEN